VVVAPGVTTARWAAYDGFSQVLDFDGTLAVTARELYPELIRRIRRFFNEARVQT
jgi:hypothetical protein